MQNKQLSPEQQERLFNTLEVRFQKNMLRHKELDWASVLKKLESHPTKLWSLNEMESTGGEPDVVAYNATTDEYTFFDCSKESPKERRSLCYDPTALDERKEHKPKHSAIGMAAEMEIEILNEEQYRYLQTLGHFDTTTSSWILTPLNIRNLGGALFGDYRFGQVFIYHNTAQSYYGARGFRGALKV